jgi:pyruvate/2-oxoglutarate/acetoin dehydrogenase E1 component
MPSLVKSDPFLRNHLIRDAIGQALYEGMRDDSAIHLFGEGAEVKVHYDTPQIEADFQDRIHTLPISEDGNTNFAVGASLLGVKPVVDVIAGDFLYRTLDSIANTAAKLDFVSGVEHTIVIRAEFLIGGPTTGQRPEALFAHIPGLRVVVPSTPRDAYGLMHTALHSPGVTLFFEDRMILDEDIEEDDLHFHLGGAVGSRGPIPFASAYPRNHWWKEGIWPPDVTVLAYGVMRERTEAVVRSVEEKVDFLDLRTLYPLDWTAIRSSVRGSKRLLIVEPDVAYGGVGAEIVATIAEEMPGVRVRRLGAPRATIPASASLHVQMLPTSEEIARGITDWD